MTGAGKRPKQSMTAAAAARRLPCAPVSPSFSRAARSVKGRMKPVMSSAREAASRVGGARRGCAAAAAAAASPGLASAGAASCACA
jgi:hypothetical protein